MTATVTLANLSPAASGRPVRIGSLFSGYGGLDLAVAAHYGATVAWHVEVDRHPSTVLARHCPDVPNWKTTRPDRATCTPGVASPGSAPDSLSPSG